MILYKHIMKNYWRTKRRAIYIILFIILILSFTFYKIYPYLYPAKTCSDGIQNNDERGIDCGGSCELICKNDISPLNVKFARYIQSEDGLYDIVAMIENKNDDKNIQDSIIDYNFSIYDKAGRLLKSILGSTSLPIGQLFPVIIQNIPLDFDISGNNIGRVSFNIVNNDKSWIKVDPVFKNIFFKVLSSDFEVSKNDISQLRVNIKNMTKASFRDVPVRVLLSDKKENIIATNETILKEISGNGEKELVFTWRKPLEIENPNIEVYFIVTPNTYIK